MVGLLVTGLDVSTGDVWSCAGAAAATSVGTVRGVPGALDIVGELDPGAGAELGTAGAGTNGSETGGVAALSPVPNTAASRSFRRLKRGGLSCLGGRAGRDRRGLSLLLWGAPSPNFFPSNFWGRRSVGGLSYLVEDSASSGLNVSIGLEGH